MKGSRYLPLLLILVLSASLVSCAGYGTSVHTHTIQGHYALHVPVSHVQVLIPKNGFVQKDARQVGGSDSPRYFWFEDDNNRIIISGWFESETVFPGVREFWEKETRAYAEKGLPAGMDVIFEKIGNWEAIIYDIQNPNYTNSHIRAHRLQSGTWIDIHLSIFAKSPAGEARSTLKHLLNSVRVEKVRYYPR